MSGEKLMTVKDIADFLCVHPQTVYQLIYQRKIPFIRKKGLGYRFSPDEIKRWLDKDQQSPRKLHEGFPKL